MTTASTPTFIDLGTATTDEVDSRIRQELAKGTPHPLVVTHWLRDEA